VTENDTVTFVDGRASAGDSFAFRDRSGWIALFGWIQIAMAALVLLSIPLAFVNPQWTRQALGSPTGDLGGSAPATTGGDAPVKAMGPAIVSSGFNLLTAAFFAWTGIGTLKVSRWARTLVLSAAKLWLLTGIVAMVYWLWTAPALGTMLASTSGVEVPPAIVGLLIAVVTLVVAFLYVVLPSAFVLFFRSAAVRLTFERLDPVPSFTESVPAPVLSLTLTLALLSATALVFAPLGVIGVFGIVWTGAAAVISWLAVAVLIAYLTRAYWRLQPVGWWGTLIATLLATAAAVTTIAQVDLSMLLLAAGFPEEQIEALQWMGLTSRPALQTLTLLSAGLVLVSLFRTFRFFRGRPTV